jgi:L-asparaginase
MAKKKLLFIHTGGTLGMVSDGNPGPLCPSAYAENLLPYVRGLEERVDIEGRVLSNLDSSDLTPVHWEKMADLIASEMDNFDGFLVLHGTDTMSYTASALSFMLQGLKKPVIITGSQRPVSNPRTDARSNLIHSTICATLPIPEVGLYFGSHLFRGNCATKVSIQAYEAFKSPNRLPLVEIGVDIEKITPSLIVDREFSLHKGFSRKVTVIQLYPGVWAGQLTAAINAGAEGIVLIAFGAGNIPMKEWPEGIAAATAAGIPVVICTQSLEGRAVLGRYSGGAAAERAGAVCAGAMTRESAIVKTMFLLPKSRDISDFQEAWRVIIAGEDRPHS